MFVFLGHTCNRYLHFFLQERNSPLYLGKTPSHSGSASKPPESGGSLPKVIVGSVAIGAAFFAAYQTGYLDQLLGKQQQSSLKTAKIVVENRDAKDIQHSIEQLGSGGAEEPNKFDIDHPRQKSVAHENEDPNKVSPAAEHAEQKVEAHLDLPHLEPLSERQGDDHTQVQDKSETTLPRVLSLSRRKTC